MKDEKGKTEKIEEIEDSIKKLEKELEKLKEPEESEIEEKTKIFKVNKKEDSEEVEEEDSEEVEDEEDSEEVEEDSEEIEEESLENMEFNNEEEDLKTIREEKWKRSASTRKTLLIIGGIVFVIGIILLLTSGGLFVKEKVEEHKEKEEQEEKTPEEDSSPIVYKTNKGAFYLNKYVIDYENYTIKNINTKKTINLKSDKNTDDMNIYFYEQKEDLYFAIDIIKGTNNGREFIVKKVNNDTVTTILEKKCKSTELACAGVVIENGNMKGFFEASSKTIYLFNENGYKKYSLNNITLNDSATILTIYDGNYIIDSNIPNDLYDIRNDKKVTNGQFDYLYHIEKDKYGAKKGDKVAIIDATGKILLDFKYTKISKFDKYYVAAVDDIKNLVLLDSNYNKVCAVNEESDCSRWLVDTYYSTKVNDYYITKTGTELMIYSSSFKKIATIATTDEIVGTYSDTILITYSHSKGYSFYNIETGENLGYLNTFWKNFGDYKATFKLEKNGIGTLSITKGEEEIGKLENASFNAFIHTDNSGITLKEDRIIYNAKQKYFSKGDVLIIKR